jgi:hypothetical protein
MLTSLAGAAPALGVTLLADTVVVKSQPDANFGTLSEIGVVGTTPPTGGTCGSAAESYLRFNLSGLDPIKSAALTVNSLGFSGGSMTMRLWGISAAGANSWSESGTAGIKWSNKPAVDRDLKSTANAAATGPIVFGSSPEFVQYLEERRATADATATIVIIMDTCSGSAVEQRLGSRENTTPALQPSLDVVSTAVTLRTFGAAAPAVNWPLIGGLGGLGVLAAVVIGGLVVSRKRAARG